MDIAIRPTPPNNADLGSHRVEIYVSPTAGTVESYLRTLESPWNLRTLLEALGRPELAERVRGES